MPPAERLFAENLALKAELADLRAQVAWFQRQIFAGSRSEKLPVETTRQTKLALPETPQSERATQVITYERRAPAPEKRPLPAEVFAQLPVQETVVIVPDEVQAEPAAFEQISEERTFEVDVVPPKLFKREIVRRNFGRTPLVGERLPGDNLNPARRQSETGTQAGDFLGVVGLSLARLGAYAGP